MDKFILNVYGGINSKRYKINKYMNLNNYVVHICDAKINKKHGGVLCCLLNFWEINNR